jgi:4-hydroxythreonine-4-phosphate dehydrogenase
MPLPRLAITLGDVSGIGPEVVSKALLKPSIYKVCRPIVVGDECFLPSFEKIAKKYSVEFVSVPVAENYLVKPGRYSKSTGRNSYESTKKAVELVEAEKADAIVSGPVCKAAMYLAGVDYPGQTELLADLTQSRKFAMLMSIESKVTAMVTRHIPIKEVSKNITISRITDISKLVWELFVTKYKNKNPRIAVSSLNPHAGEGGLLGHEEKNVIIPAISLLKDQGILLSGPFPPDSAWVKMQNNEYDALITMYHDQAMIGVKCLAPKKVVNLTIGLPFIRTSPGHGTAFDIAGKNIADSTPMEEAIKLAARLS